MAVAAAMVDSWLSLGGDRRKAQRHFAKLVRLHPFFTALAEVQACLAGEEGAPVRAEVGANWQLVVATLGLEFADAED